MEFTPHLPTSTLPKKQKWGKKGKDVYILYFLSLFLNLNKPAVPPRLRLRLPTARRSSASVCLLSFLGCRRPLEVPDLFDQIVLLVTELLILRSVRLEVAQELHQLGLVFQQYVHHRLSLAGVCHKHLVKSGGMRSDAVNRR